jgi:hypothetical protein
MDAGPSEDRLSASQTPTGGDQELDLGAYMHHNVRISRGTPA